MRRLLTLILLPAFVLACGGDSPTDEGNGDGNGNGNGNGGGNGAPFAAQVNGQDWTPSNVFAAYQAEVLQIAATDGERGFNLGVFAPSTGTYTTANTPSMVATYTDGTDGWVAGSGVGSGTVNITAISATGATGTFSFTLQGVPGTGTEGSVSVSGSFNLVF